MAFIALAMMYYGVILFLLRKTSLEEAVRPFDNVQLSDLIIKWDRTMIIVYSLTFFLFNIFYFAVILGTYWVLPSVWGTKSIYNTLHLYNISIAPHTEVQKAIKHFYKRSQFRTASRQFFSKFCTFYLSIHKTTQTAQVNLTFEVQKKISKSPDGQIAPT